MGKPEKTERIDAEVIARHAAARRISPTQPASEEQQRLTALATRLRQVTGDLSVQKQRLHSTRDPVALASLREAIAKLAGLAPIANDSGKRSGPRSIRGDRAAVRSILFLVADLARKVDPSLAEFRQRLLDQGKPKMVVRIALARKLLVRLNAKARETRPALAS